MEGKQGGSLLSERQYIPNRENCEYFARGHVTFQSNKVLADRLVNDSFLRNLFESFDRKSRGQRETLIAFCQNCLAILELYPDCSFILRVHEAGCDDNLLPPCIDYNFCKSCETNGSCKGDDLYSAAMTCFQSSWSNTRIAAIFVAAMISYLPRHEEDMEIADVQFPAPTKELARALKNEALNLLKSDVKFGKSAF